MPLGANLHLFREDAKEKDLVKNLKKILDKKRFWWFIVLVIWLVAIARKIKERDF